MNKTDGAKPRAAAAPARKLFGTDGIRGVANVHPMTPEIAMKVGAAVTWWASRGGRAARVVIGKDTRLSGYMLETALAAGVCAQGGRVMLTGPMPTPAVAYLAQSMRADAGVVISASHNPYADNGIKLFGPDGFKLPDAAEAEIEALMDDPRLLTGRRTEGGVGRAEKIEDARGRYVTFVKSTFPGTFGSTACVWWSTARTAPRTGSPRWCLPSSAHTSRPSASSPTAKTSTTTTAPCTPRPWPRRWSSDAPTSASPSTATPTGSSWWTSRATS
jgi:phosphomannomutase